MSNSTKISPLFIAIALVALAIGVFTQFSGNKQPDLPEFAKAIILPKPKELSDAAFVDHLGQPFGLEQLHGKWSIIFFGFTNCPDICPTTMQTLSAVKAKVSAAGSWDNYRVIMITVDPDRDTTERLANYVPYFDSEFIGLSSDAESTAAFAKQLGILFVKRDEEPSDEHAGGFYQVDHSASIILINPQGQWAGAITAPHKEDEISDDLIKLAKYSAELEPQLANNNALKPSPESTQQAATPALSEPALAADQTDEQARIKAAQPTLSISNGWIRPAPPNVPSMAAYFDLINSSDADVTIVGVHSEAFAHAMIHDTKTVDGLASMEHLDELIIPANSRVALAPLGLHVMLMRPVEPLDKGESTELSLTASDGRVYTFPLSVRDQP